MEKCTEREILPEQSAQEQSEKLNGMERELDESDRSDGSDESDEERSGNHPETNSARDEGARAVQEEGQDSEEDSHSEEEDSEKDGDSGESGEAEESGDSEKDGDAGEGGRDGGSDAGCSREEMERLIAEAEARGYERGRSAGIEAWINESRQSGVAAHCDTFDSESEIMILNNMRPSVWD